MNRREFLVSGAAVASLAASRAAFGQRSARDRIGIMSYSFNRLVKHPGASDPARTLDPLDIPQMFADRYGVHLVELQHTDFHATEPDFLDEMKRRLARAGSRVTQINLEFAVNMSAPEHYRRLEAIELTKRWVEIALHVGSPRVMLNQGGLAPEVRPTAIEAYRAMRTYGDSRGVWVTLENRGQSGWEAVEEVVRLAGGYTTPDLGNFPDQETQHRGIPELMRYHRGNAHVKLNPARYDAAEAIRLAERLGYDGVYSIEATQSADPDPYVGTQKILDLLLANIRAR